jgi:hypothetical protein
MSASLIKQVSRLKYQARTEHLLQKEAWGMLALCSSTNALIAATTSDPVTKLQAISLAKQLTEFAFALDSVQSKRFAEENEMYISKAKSA